MTHEHKEDGCCGDDKHHEQSHQKKEKDSCCGSEKDKKSDLDKTEKQGDCCGRGK